MYRITTKRILKVQKPSWTKLEQLILGEIATRITKWNQNKTNDILKTAEIP